MGEYVANQKTARNIKMVMHVGDIINGSGSSSQFALAEAGRDELSNSGIPYTFAPGNWDYAGGAQTATRGLTGYNNYFPASSYNTKDWFGGAYETGKSENIYFIQTINGQKWMFLSVEFYPRTAVFTWMNDVIASEDPDFTVVTTHSYLDRGERDLPTEDFWDGRLIESDFQYGPDSYGSAFTTSGEDMYNSVISQNDSIILVLNGHVLDGRNDDLEPNYPGTNNGVVAHSGKQFTHSNGNICSQIVYNHQEDLIPGCITNDQNGTAAALHFFEIDPNLRQITVTGYDPVHAVDMADLGDYPTSRPDWSGS